MFIFLLLLSYSRGSSRGSTGVLHGSHGSQLDGLAFNMRTSSLDNIHQHHRSPVSSYLPPATAVFYTFSMYTLLTIRKNVSELDLCLFFSSRLLRFTLSLLLQLTRLVSVYQKNTTSDHSTMLLGLIAATSDTLPSRQTSMERHYLISLHSLKLTPWLTLLLHLSTSHDHQMMRTRRPTRSMVEWSEVVFFW